VTLGSAIKVVRTAGGIRQRELAKKIGVTANYLSLVEGGKREPSVAVLNRLAKALGIPVGIFFVWQEVSDDKVDTNSLNKIRELLARLEAMYVAAKSDKHRRRKRVA
jgi:transcriptional regulator with XRE-family HTH domain